MQIFIIANLMKVKNNSETNDTFFSKKAITVSTVMAFLYFRIR